MIYNIGVRALKRLVLDQDGLAFHSAKLSDQLFKATEKPVFTAVQLHLSKHKKLPTIETLEAMFPAVKDDACPEPASYYLELLQNRFEYDQINAANLQSQEILKNDKMAVGDSFNVLQAALNKITEQRYRTKVMDFGKEGADFLLTQYHSVLTNDQKLAGFGWPYLDEMTGGILGGDVVSFVGRPGMGKTWLGLNTAIHNWRKQKFNVLFVSMEMNILAISQRLGTMYAHTPIKPLKKAEYSSHTLQKFGNALKGLSDETSKLYVVNGNLAAEVDEIYTLADQLSCEIVVFDGAYMLAHPNKRLDRYTRAAVNTELMKKQSEIHGFRTFASWQLNRDATKKDKKAQPGQKKQYGLEDIGYTDVVGQISSIVLGLMQEEGIETMNQRVIDVMKGRSGEIGRFSVKWDFVNMDFDQVEDDAPAIQAAYV